MILAGRQCGELFEPRGYPVKQLTSPELIAGWIAVLAIEVLALSLSLQRAKSILWGYLAPSALCGFGGAVAFLEEERFVRPEYEELELGPDVGLLLDVQGPFLFWACVWLFGMAVLLGIVGRAGRAGWTAAVEETAAAASPKLSGFDSGLRWIAIAGIAVNTLWRSWQLIDGARSPDYGGYRFRAVDRAMEWAYPTYEVVTWVGVFAIEALAAAVLLRIVRGSTGWLCFLLAMLSGCASVCWMIPLRLASLPYQLQGIHLFADCAWLMLMAATAGFVSCAWPERPPAVLAATELPRACVARR
ncbi:MAG TPA: hypothetical protein VNO30_17515 [Kofleriaceae bacterium]|nr:hypothetical protein [Kofleriaceae bacterium]